MKLGTYRHSKTGNFYKVIAVAKDSETLEDFVVYEALYENPTSKFWIRSKNNFEQEVNVGGKLVRRFVFVG